MKCSRISPPDPPDLGADSPGTVRSIDPVSRPDLPLLGFPKIAPPPFQTRESTPGTALWKTRAWRLRERDAISLLVPPAWFSTTSTACSSRILRTCCSALPAMGFTPFPPATKLDFPACPSALRSFLPAGSCTCRSGCGLTSPRRTIAGPPRSPSALPSRPFPPRAASECRPRFPVADLRQLTRRAGASRPCSSSRARCRDAVSSVSGPVLPWACPA